MSAATPTISGNFDDANSVVHLTVNSIGATSVVVSRSINGGPTIAVRYSNEVAGTSGTFLIDDHETPQRGTITYTARGYDAAGNASAVSAAFVINLAGSAFWLKDPINPGLSLQLRPEQVSITYKKVRQQVTFVPLRGTRKYVLNGPMLGYEFTNFSLFLYNNDEFTALESLLNNGNTLLLKMDDGRTFYVRVTAEVSYEELVTTARSTKPLRRVSLGLIETVAP